MKEKVIKVFLFFLILCFLSSCASQSTTDGQDTVIQDAISQFVLPDVVDDDIDIVDYIEVQGKVVYLYWDIDNLSAIDYRGNVTRSDKNQDVTIKITFSYDLQEVIETYHVTVLAYSELEYLQMEMAHFSLPDIIYDEYQLPNTCQNENISLSWASSNPEIIDNVGVKQLPDELTEVKLTLTLQLANKSLSKEFIVMVKSVQTIDLPKQLNYLHTADYFQDGIMLNLEVSGEYLTMTKDEATYLSPIYVTEPFSVLVATWSAIATQDTGSIELTYRLRVNGVWSDYVTYGEWCLGNKNKSKSGKTKDGLIKMDEDTISVLNDKKADAFQYQIYFKKDSDKEPVKLRLVNTTVNVDVTDTLKPDLPNSVLYDVPKLYQRIVPSIGGSICSPTSMTMMLKYYGHDFKDMGYQYEHEYMAWLVYDYGDMIFGNWSYNVAVAGAMGEFAYLGLFSGVYDLMDTLANIGPVALSVKGNMQGYYNTNGHLLVCKGYKVTDEGIIFICNDPNIQNVEVEYTMDTINSVWRNYAYVIVK